MVVDGGWPSPPPAPASWPGCPPPAAAGACQGVALGASRPAPGRVGAVTVTRRARSAMSAPSGEHATRAGGIPHPSVATSPPALAVQPPPPEAVPDAGTYC